MTLLVGVLTGWVATRNSRKLPHELLKQLVDIRQELGSLDRDRVIDAAIRRELRLLKRLNEAREVSRWKYMWERIRQNPVVALAVSFLTGYFSLATLLVLLKEDEIFQRNLNTLQRLAVAIPLALIAAFSLAVIAVTLRTDTTLRISHGINRAARKVVLPPLLLKFFGDGVSAGDVSEEESSPDPAGVSIATFSSSARVGVHRASSGLRRPT